MELIFNTNRTDKYTNEEYKANTPYEFSEARAIEILNATNKEVTIVSEVTEAEETVTTTNVLGETDIVATKKKRAK